MFLGSLIFLSLGAFAQTQIPAAPIFDSDAFEKKMGIQPLGDDFPSFFGFTGDPNSEKYFMGLSIVTYKCRGGTEITLYPMVHTAEPSYFKHVDDLARKSDLILYESVRPAYFSGPPFDKDPSIKTSDDYARLTARRLQTLAQQIQDFHSQNSRDPASINELFSSRGMDGPFAAVLAKKLLVDSWGHPILIKMMPSGRPIIQSLGPDGIESGDDMKVSAAGPTLPVNAGTASTIEMMKRQEEIAKTAGLTWQKSYAFESYLTSRSINADISADMFAVDLPSKERVANTRLRNVMPILKIEELRAERKLPKTIAIIYGTDHMLKFHQYLIGRELACTQQKADWQTAIDGGNELKVQGFTNDQLNLRRTLINSFSRKAPVLDVDVMGVGSTLKAYKQ